MEGPSAPLDRILCVDDEPSVRRALRRILFPQFEVVTAEDGTAGLKALQAEGPFAVVLSDMRMPGMDGAQFLSLVYQRAPDTVRILLTGQADTEAAIRAINEGAIFRFLIKPCPPETLVSTLRAATAQYRLATAERELLEHTLRGTVQVLVDILGIAAPVIFSRSNQLRAYAGHVAKQLDAKKAWSYELAAMLSQLGCITLPIELMDKVWAGEEMTADEKRMFDGHPEVAHRLLSQIPRLQPVASMIRGQQRSWTVPDESQKLGADILRAVVAIDRLVSQGHRIPAAVRIMRQTGEYNEQVLNALATFPVSDRKQVIRTVKVAELETSMVLAEDVRTRSGHLVLAQGRELNAALVQRLRNFDMSTGLVQPIRVRVVA